MNATKSGYGGESENGDYEIGDKDTVQRGNDPCLEVKMTYGQLKATLIDYGKVISSAAWIRPPCSIKARWSSSSAPCPLNITKDYVSHVNHFISFGWEKRRKDMCILMK